MLACTVEICLVLFYLRPVLSCFLKVSQLIQNEFCLMGRQCTPSVFILLLHTVIFESWDGLFIEDVVNSIRTTIILSIYPFFLLYFQSFILMYFLSYCCHILIYKILVQYISFNKRFPSFIVYLSFTKLCGLHPFFSYLWFYVQFFQFIFLLYD